MVALFIRPDADISDGGWTDEGGATTLFDAVDESSFSDTDYIKSSASIGDKVSLRLSDPAAAVTEPMTVRYRAKREGGGLTDLVGRIYEATSPPTLICLFEAALTDSFVTYTHELPASEFAAIVDFNNLYIEFESNPSVSHFGSQIDLNFKSANYYNQTDPLVNQTITDYLSISRASVAYAETLSGSLTQFGTNTMRITDKGLLVEDSRTNVVLWNRDLTNAAWTKTNITAVKDQTGPDGVSNSASSILATAGNATVLQSITLASSARFQSAYVKRITGTGTIEMTMDNGSTWTAITVTSSWTLAAIPTQTIANPVVGFRIVTNTDKIAVDFVQNEEGIWGSSPIPTTTVSATRAADRIEIIGSLATLLKASTGSVMVKLDRQPSYTTAGYNAFVIDTVAAYDFNLRGDQSGNDKVSSYFSSALTATAATAWTVGDFNAALAYDGSGRSMSANGGTIASDSQTLPAITNIYLGSDASHASSIFGYVNRLTSWNSRLADAIIQSLTAL